MTFETPNKKKLLKRNLSNNKISSDSLSNNL